MTTESGVKPNVSAPTAAEFKKGPVVTLTRPGWATYRWSPHGFLYPIRFENSKAKVLESHFDLWIGDEQAAVNGITVTRPKAKSKPEDTTSTAAEKA